MGFDFVTAQANPIGRAACKKTCILSMAFAYAALYYVEVSQFEEPVGTSVGVFSSIGRLPLKPAYETAKWYLTTAQGLWRQLQAQMDFEGPGWLFTDNYEVVQDDADGVTNSDPDVAENTGRSRPSGSSPRAGPGIHYLFFFPQSRGRGHLLLLFTHLSIMSPSTHHLPHYLFMYHLSGRHEAMSV